ncbi:glycosyltransferase family 4 protein [Paenibacillus algorifonticola]|uniref:glycosyltransferase family 4 protein n=1 Tax=Paenibacillus algorifonticola TaxID=684063 RepID=UPI003D29020C
MRILIACSWSLPHAGGVNTYVNQLEKGLKLAGHHVDIFSPTPDGQGFYLPGKEMAIDKAKLQPLIAHQSNHYMDHHLSGIDPWITFSEIERYCFEAAAMYFGLAEYDMIHAQDIMSAHALSRVKPSHTPLVTTIHGCLTREWFIRLKTLGLTDQDTSSLIWKYSALREHLGATVSDVTISPSEWLKRVMVEDFAVPEPHITVSHYGFDKEQFQQSMLRDSMIVKPEGISVFLCPARFDVVKGHIYLIHALAKLKAERSDWVCWLAGEGSLREELMNITKDHGLGDHVIFLGNREDVPALIHQADFIVLPSMQDNQPFAVIEAQIAGKPVIASDAGGIPEMVTHSVNGLVFPAGDINELHLCLRSALQDTKRLSSLASQAKEWGEQHWALPEMTNRVLALYELARSKYPEQNTGIEPQTEQTTTQQAEQQLEPKLEPQIEPQPEQQTEQQSPITPLKRGRRKWRANRRKKQPAAIKRRRKIRNKQRKFTRKRS